MVVFFGQLPPSAPPLEALRVRAAKKADLKVDKVQTQHAALQHAVRDLGHAVEMVPSNSETWDGVFVSDSALLLPEVAVVVRPNGPRGDRDSIAHVLARHRPVQWLADGEAFSGHDVLRIGRTLYVAISPRTNAEAVSTLREIVRPFGYEVKTVETRADVSLREACSFIPPHFLLFNAEWIDGSTFGDLSLIPVATDEPGAAATLTLGETTLMSASFPQTEKLLRAGGVAVRKMDISELEKIGGHLARLVLVKEPRAARPAPVAHGSHLTVVETPQVPSPGNAAHAIVHGGLVYVSAQLPFDPSEVRPHSMSPEKQTERVLRNVEAVLQAAGSSLADVLQATVHLADPKHLERIEASYARMFAGHRPTRSIISNRALPVGVLVEIEAVAAVSIGRRR